MTLEERMKKAYANLKAPKGKYVVCVWNPSNPNKSIPEIDGRPYLLFEKAVEYVKIMNDKEQSRNIRERAVVGPDLDYFVVDDKGCRVY
jgi:hypothetical protein